MVIAPALALQNAFVFPTEALSPLQTQPPFPSPARGRPVLWSVSMHWTVRGPHVSGIVWCYVLLGLTSSASCPQGLSCWSGCQTLLPFRAELKSRWTDHRVGILSAPGGHPGGLCRPYKKNPIQSSEPTYPRGHILFPNEYKEIETQAENLIEITGWCRETLNTHGQPEPFPVDPAWSCPALGPDPSCLCLHPSFSPTRSVSVSPRN